MTPRTLAAGAVAAVRGAAARRSRRRLPRRRPPIGAATLCGQPVPAPAQLPPAGSGPLVYVLGLCFSTQGNQSAVEPETYLYYLRLRPSRPSQREWVPYDDSTRETIKEDFRRLWATGFLDDLKVEATDYAFANGVVGKIVTYHLEERARVRLVKYEGAGDLEQTKIDESLREHGAEIKLDAFLDQGVIRRARTVLRDLLAEKGFAAAEVSSAIEPIGGSAKLVSLIFNVTRGPKLVIRDVAFIGNRAVADGDLAKVLKNNRPQGLLSLVTSRGAYNETTFADDAQRVEDYYRDQGYVAVRVGQPEVRTLDDSADGKTRFVQLRIPVYEGRRYRVGTIGFEGQTIVRTEALQAIFKLKPGAWYRQQRIRDGLTKAREILRIDRAHGVHRLPRPEAARRARGRGGRHHAAARARGGGGGPAIVDVVMRLSEGPRYVINRIAFKGNTITRDDVIRRELNLYEGGVFNTEALKHSVRRLNQLGYFKALEGSDKDLKVDKANGVADAVDLTFTLEEQNRNQMQFGGGVSQYDGAFFNLAYTTTNLLGRGESLTLTGQKGTRSSIYQVAFTEPYAFNRPITAGVEVYSRKVDLLTSANTIGYSEVRAGGNLTLGRQLFRYSRVLRDLRLRGRRHRGQRGAARLARRHRDDAAVHPVPRQRPPHREPDHAGLRLQHGRQPLHAAQRPAPVDQHAGRRRHPRRHDQLHPPRSGGHPLFPAHAADRARRAAERRPAAAVRRHPRAALLPALRHGRRVPDPRRRAALGRSARREPARHRRRQVRAVQRGVLPRHVRPGARAAVPRRRPGLRREPADRPAAAAHVDRRRAARHRADAERAVPPDLRLEHLSRRVPAGAGAEVRRRHDLLMPSETHACRPAPEACALVVPC